MFPIYFHPNRLSENMLETQKQTSYKINLKNPGIRKHFGSCIKKRKTDIHFFSPLRTSIPYPTIQLTYLAISSGSPSVSERLVICTGTQCSKTLQQPRTEWHSSLILYTQPCISATTGNSKLTFVKCGNQFFLKTRNNRRRSDINHGYKKVKYTLVLCNSQLKVIWSSLPSETN